MSVYYVQIYQKELDCQNDKWECLVKLSRDCTTHSKRTIFLLHRVKHDITAGPSNIELFSEADKKVEETLAIIKKISTELQNEDSYKFHSAYTIGIEEFIEAVSFYVFLKEGRLVSLREVQEKLTFQMKESNLSQQSSTDLMEEDKTENETSEKKDRAQDREWSSPQTAQKHFFPLSTASYILGLADLTGELMRLAINAVGTGNRQLPFTVLNFIRLVYCNFLRMWTTSCKNLPKKIETMKNNLMKIEQVCYTIRVRGSENTNQLLADIVNI